MGPQGSLFHLESQDQPRGAGQGSWPCLQGPATQTRSHFPKQPAHAPSPEGAPSPNPSPLHWLFFPLPAHWTGCQSDSCTPCIPGCAHSLLPIRETFLVLHFPPPPAPPVSSSLPSLLPLDTERALHFQASVPLQGEVCPGRGPSRPPCSACPSLRAAEPLPGTAPRQVHQGPAAVQAPSMRTVHAAVGKPSAVLQSGGYGPCGKGESWFHCGFDYKRDARQKGLESWRDSC